MSDWKTAVRAYIDGRNQTEVNGTAEPLRRVISEKAFALLHKDRLERLDETLCYRKIRVLQNETRARLLEVDETGGEVRLKLELFRKQTYEQAHGRHSEQRIEQERLLLRQTGNGGWLVARIQPVVSEKSAAHAAQQAAAMPLAPDPYGFGKLPPPFLNEKLLSPSYKVPRSIKYNRELVRQYADRWWDSYSPDYEAFDVDCTNYVSQCVFAGGAPMNYTGNRAAGWWYQGRKGKQEMWSFSWAVSNSLQSYLSGSRTGLTAEPVETAEELTIGDVITYDWDGDGRYQHSTVVTAIDSAGMPLVNAHTTASKHRYWDYRDSYAWTPQTRYRFFHIADYFQ